MNELFIDDKQYDKNVKSIKQLIKDTITLKEAKYSKQAVWMKAARTFSDKYAIQCDKPLTNQDVFNLVLKIAETTYDDSKDRGSASFSVFNNNWIAGMLGSMWCDIKYQKECESGLYDSMFQKQDFEIRICFYNDLKPLIYFQIIHE